MKQKTYQIVLDGIVITVTKKRIKNMYLRIKKEDGMVLISAPYQMSDLRIRRFAEERLPWIREYQEKYKEQNFLSVNQIYLSGRKAVNSIFSLKMI